MQRKLIHHTMQKDDNYNWSIEPWLQRWKARKGNYFYKFIKKEKGSTQELEKHNDIQHYKRIKTKSKKIYKTN